MSSNNCRSDTDSTESGIQFQCLTNLHGKCFIFFGMFGFDLAVNKRWKTCCTASRSACLYGILWVRTKSFLYSLFFQVTVLLGQ